MPRPARESPHWATLLDRTRSREPEAESELLEWTRAWMRREARGRIPRTLRGKVSESDIVQESLIKLGPGIAGFKGESEEQYRIWLGRLLRTEINEIERRYLATEQRDLRLEVDLDHATEVHSTDRTPSSLVRRKETDHELISAIERLPPKQQAVLRLRHKHQLSWDAIAKELGTTGEAARKVWSRALRKLEAELSPDFEAGPKDRGDRT